MTPAPESTQPPELTREEKVKRDFVGLVWELEQCDPKFIQGFAGTARKAIAGVRRRRMAAMHQGGSSPHEIGVAFGIDGNAVRADIWRARKKPETAIEFPVSATEQAGRPYKMKRATPTKLVENLAMIAAAGDYFEIPCATTSPKHNTLYVQARRKGWRVSVTRVGDASVRVTAVEKITAPESPDLTA